MPQKPVNWTNCRNGKFILRNFHLQYNNGYCNSNNSICKYHNLILIHFLSSVNEDNLCFPNFLFFSRFQFHFHVVFSNSLSCPKRKYPNKRIKLITILIDNES